MYAPNERLLTAIHMHDFDQALACLRNGETKATTLLSCGRTAVGIAALVGDAEILELLIQSCEEPDLTIFGNGSFSANETEMLDKTPDGMEQLEWEEEFGDGTSIEEEEEHISLYIYYAKTFEQTGAILLSSMDNMYSERNRLIQDPHTVDAMRMSPLHYAAACGHLDCTRILLDHGANVHAMNSDGYTPLHVSIEFCEITRELIKHDADPNLRTIDTGETALHMAIRSRCYAVAKILLANGANVNAIDDIDQTPLICAIIHDVEGVVHELLDRGARINMLDMEGRSAVYYACLQDNLPIVSRLLKQGARVCTSYYLLHHCVCYSQVCMAELLVAAYPDSLNVRNKDGLTPLHLAIVEQNVEMLAYFLQVVRSADCEMAPLKIDHELAIAVHYLNTLSEFKPIARVLFAYSGSEWMAPAPEAALAATPCYTPHCQAQLLARPIMQHKIDIAAFLIKEGADIAQLCGEQVIKYLRSTLMPGCVEFVRLLLHAGLQWSGPAQPGMASAAHQVNWCSERKQFEAQLRELTEKPLPLQSLARLAIRRHLLSCLSGSIAAKPKHTSTNGHSRLGHMVSELEIPRTLQLYLVDFDDCSAAAMQCSEAPPQM